LSLVVISQQCLIVPQWLWPNFHICCIIQQYIWYELSQNKTCHFFNVTSWCYYLYLIGFVFAMLFIRIYNWLRQKDYKFWFKRAVDGSVGVATWRWWQWLWSICKSVYNNSVVAKLLPLFSRLYYFCAQVHAQHLYD
jgi:hypothetical protein